MCEILDALHEYVPSVTEKTELISDDGETISHLDYYLIRQLLGDDTSQWLELMVISVLEVIMKMPLVLLKDSYQLLRIGIHE